MPSDPRTHLGPDPDEPVDGFTVEREGAEVTLTLTSRYGAGEAYTLDALDAARIGHALVGYGLAALVESQLTPSPGKVHHPGKVDHPD